MARAALADDAIATLEGDLRGRLVRPADPDYDDVRAVWNGVIDAHPALVARCRGVADVITSVDFARDHDLPLSVRGGGHNVAGTAVCDDGIVVDCSEMRSVSVDPEARTVRVQAGATWADVDHETQAFGLATPGGVVSDTGVAGLTLGGGIGHLRCAYGLTCDNVRAADVVTADGEFVTASADSHPDLFWACKGGGGNFGVVTAFEFDCHPVGPEVATCLVFYPSEVLPDFLEFYREYVADAPREVSSLVFAGEMPDEALFDAGDVHRGKFAAMGLDAADVDEGEHALAPLREFADPLADVSGVMPYAEFQQLLDEDYPDGMRYYWKSLYLDELSTAAIDRITYWADAAPSPLSTVDVWQLGGAITDAGIADSAFAGRHAPFLLGVEANWEDPSMDDENVAWVRDCLEDVRQFSDGSVYLNFPGFREDGDQDVMQRTFGPAYERLVAVKDHYDPTNLFDSNQNIAPSQAAGNEGSGGKP
jgi:FAD/FMN-containing dehydrogenase